MRLALVLFFAIPAQLHAQTANEKQKTIVYILSLQQADGGFRSDAKAKTSNLAATSSGIRALKYWGGELPNRDKTAEHVKSCFDAKSGTYAIEPGGKTAVNINAIGMMAAAELKLPADPYLSGPIPNLAENAKSFEDIRIAAAGLEAAKSFPDDLVKRWQAELGAAVTGGGFKNPFDDAVVAGSATAMVLRTGGTIPAETLAKIEQVLAAGQHEDGGYSAAARGPTNLESTYRVMRAFHLMKKKPKDVAKLKEFVSRCRNEDGGYGITPGSSSTLSGTYFAGIILHWLDL